MRLSNKIITEVIGEVIGDDAIPLVKKLKNKQNMSEFKLAEEIDVNIKDTRNMLYRLYKFNLVGFTRKKDKQKGWYIYYWTFNKNNIKYLFTKLKKKKLRRLNERLNREQNNLFYLCPNKCIRFNFDQATNFEFKCPECGELMLQEDNEKTIKNLTENIKNLTKELSTKK